MTRFCFATHDHFVVYEDLSFPWVPHRLNLFLQLARQEGAARAGRASAEDVEVALCHVVAAQEHDVPTLLRDLARRTRPSADVTAMFLEVVVKTHDGPVLSALPFLSLFCCGLADDVAAVLAAFDAAMALRDATVSSACLASLADVLVTAAPEALKVASEWIINVPATAEMIPQLARSALLCVSQDEEKDLTFKWLRGEWAKHKYSPPTIAALAAAVAPALLSTPGLCDDFLAVVKADSDGLCVADTVVLLALLPHRPVVASEVLVTVLTCIQLEIATAAALFCSPAALEQASIFPMLSAIVDAVARGDRDNEPVLQWLPYVLGTLYTKYPARRRHVVAQLVVVFRRSQRSICDMLDVVVAHISKKRDCLDVDDWAGPLIAHVADLFVFGDYSADFACEVIFRCCASIAEIGVLVPSVRFGIEQTVVTLARSALVSSRILCLCLTKHMWASDCLSPGALDAVLSSFFLVSPAKFERGKYDIIVQIYLLELLAVAPANPQRERSLMEAVLAKPADMEDDYLLQANPERLSHGMFASAWHFRGLNMPDFRPAWVMSAIKCLAHYNKGKTWTGVWLAGGEQWTEDSKLNEKTSWQAKSTKDLPLLIATYTGWLNCDAFIERNAPRVPDLVGFACRIRAMAGRVPVLKPAIFCIPPLRLEMLINTLVSPTAWNRMRLAAVLDAVWTDLEPAVRFIYMRQGDLNRQTCKKTMYGTVRPPKSKNVVLAQFSELPYNAVWDLNLRDLERLWCLVKEEFWVFLQQEIEESKESFASDPTSPLVLAQCLRVAYMVLLVLHEKDPAVGAKFLTVLCNYQLLPEWIQAGLDACNSSFFSVYWIELLMAANWTQKNGLHDAALQVVHKCLRTDLSGVQSFIVPLPLALTSPFLLYRIFDSWEQFVHLRPSVRRVHYELMPKSLRPMLSLHLYMLTCFNEVLHPEVGDWLKLSKDIAISFAKPGPGLFSALSPDEVPHLYRYSLINLMRLSQLTAPKHGKFLGCLMRILNVLAERVIGSEEKRDSRIRQVEYCSQQNAVLKQLVSRVSSFAADPEADTAFVFAECRRYATMCRRFLDAKGPTLYAQLAKRIAGAAATMDRVSGDDENENDSP